MKLVGGGWTPNANHPPHATQPEVRLSWDEIISQGLPRKKMKKEV